VRIGIVTGEYPPDQGGVGDFTHELGQALVALGHEVHVLTGVRRDMQHAARGAVTIHRRIHGWRWGCWREVLRVAREERLEVLNVQFQTAAYGMHPAIHFVPRRQGRPPVVVTLHDLRVPYLFPKAGPLRRGVVQMLARRADGVIVTNREDELRIANSEWRVTNLARIPIGSNIAPHLPGDYDRDAWRARWGIGPGDLLLGYFGFLNERKGGEDLIEVLAALVARGLPAHLLLIGGRAGTSDPTNVAYAERVERLIAERGLSERVHRTGFVSSMEVSASLAAVDVCVLPYRDGVSLRHGSLHACLAHGRPIVTTWPAVETPEFRDGENMLLVPAQDIEALADSVARLATDPGSRARLAAGAATLAAEFTWERIATRTAEFFAELMA
jgi:glycosyltransferase involved in cell wall biosynthesis